MKTQTAFKTLKGKEEIMKAYDSLLKGWISNCEKLYIETCLGKTYVIASGEKDNPPLILLHGAGMNSIMWMSEAKEYAKDYRVYAVDIPGEPGKSAEIQFPLEGTSYEKWLCDVLNNLNIEKTMLLGISLGAWLATKFSINYPEKVEKLVLISPSGIGPQKKSFIFIALYYSIFGERGVEKLIYKINGNKPLPQPMLQYQKLIRKYFNYRTETIPIFSDSELKRLTMPVALFAGGKDIMLDSFKTSERLSTLLPHTIIDVKKDAGHSIVKISDKVKVFLS